MVEYAKCIYISWVANNSPEYVSLHRSEFIALCSNLLKYTPAEVEQRLAKELWYNQDVT